MSTDDPPPPALVKALSAVTEAQQGARVDESALARSVDEIVRWTAGSYSQHAGVYSAVRGVEPGTWEEPLTQLLLATVRHQIAVGRAPRPVDRRWRLVDIGAGSGRDLVRLALEPDVDAVGVDNAPSLVSHLRTLLAERGLPGTVIEADMRDLSCLQSGTFHCVRNHASLHHLPLVGPGLGMDVAIAESRRVLVTGGVLYVLTRAGVGLEMRDTGEGLGPRPFQLLTSSTLGALLERHRFAPLRTEIVQSRRGGGTIDWLLCLAEATA
ncbi:MAG TPA: class I SAM-dependent methyltransferase [Solirubrobacteraceae bacterium]|nr:class I SAM-dependent methyltransferase [Solirubrobacteraceae bacterium]